MNAGDGQNRSSEITGSAGCRVIRNVRIAGTDCCGAADAAPRLFYEINQADITGCGFRTERKQNERQIPLA